MVRIHCDACGAYSHDWPRTIDWTCAGCEARREAAGGTVVAAMVTVGLSALAALPALALIAFWVSHWGPA